MIRAIAIYLPQYHPFKENDTWWGKGFTEWRNVTKAKPLFKGHYQPHLPSDLGFYDLRIPEVREEQAVLAKAYGISGFCYYHYWFNGKLLMEKPLKEVIKLGEPDFPFMICWANENWTRAWDGGEKEILIKQEYSEEDDRNHIKYLVSNIFNDRRYIRINGKHVVAIYRSTIVPNIKRTLQIWREEALKAGIELYICRFESFAEAGAEFLEPGFDAAIDFQPRSKSMLDFAKENLSFRIINKIRSVINKKRFIKRIDYKKYVEYMIKYESPSYKQYPCITPMWDNTPRRKTDIFALTNSTPQLYGKWLNNTITKFEPYSKDENLIFIHAWNEWAEGNHLEPDIKWGRQYLEMTKKVIERKYIE